MKAWRCGWSVRHYAETKKLLKDMSSHVCFLIIRGGSNSSFLLGSDGCRKASAMPGVTPGTQPVGCGVVSPQPVHRSAAVPSVGPQFGCHGTVLGVSVRCGVAGALCLPFVWYANREGMASVLEFTAMILATPCQVAQSYLYPQVSPVGAFFSFQTWLDTCSW